MMVVGDSEEYKVKMGVGMRGVANAMI